MFSGTFEIGSDAAKRMKGAAGAIPAPDDDYVAADHERGVVPLLIWLQASTVVPRPEADVDRPVSLRDTLLKLVRNARDVRPRHDAGQRLLIEGAFVAGVENERAVREDPYGVDGQPGIWFRSYSSLPSADCRILQRKKWRTDDV